MQPAHLPSGSATTHPEKAATFFNFARGKLAAGHYEQAFLYYLSGLQHDPGNPDAVAACLQIGQGASPSLVKSLADQPTVRELDKRDRLLRALIRTALKAGDPALAFDFAERAFESNLSQLGAKMAERALAVLKNAPQQTAAGFDKITDLAMKHSLFDIAVTASENAMARNKELYERKHRDVLATNTLHRQRLEDPTTSFRDNLKDPEGQRRLASAAPPQTAQAELDHRIQQARAGLAASPEDKGKILALAALLGESADRDLRAEAVALLLKWHEQTKDVSFRHKAKDILLADHLRDVVEVEQRSAREPPDMALRHAAAAARRAYVEDLAADLERRVQEYPTESGWKLKLGKAYLELARPVEAIAQLQLAQKDPKLAPTCLQLLGKAFEALKWYEEAARVYEKLVEAHSVGTDDKALIAARFGLASTFKQLHADSSDRQFLDRALTIAREVVMEDITYPGARELRDELAAIVKGKK